jgi:hypothetical protein
MKFLVTVLAFTFLSQIVNAGDRNLSADSSALVIGVKTNSVEGYGKFGVLKVIGDTVFAVCQSSEVLPGLYIITASNKNEIYHKKLYLIDPIIARTMDLKVTHEILAMVIGVMDFENYAKLHVNLLEPDYFYASDPTESFNPGTYLIVGSSNQDLYHQKLVINH